ncbi:MAG TPA: alkaline phosphatase family protein [Longimicrobiales bacterium]|nr:alkaline phosphatase family protein [Longimicrobiales bacterium]
MKRASTAVAASLALTGLSLGPAAQARAQTGEPPTLVVMIVVDQLGGDLVNRYESVLQGGFRRFLDEGHRFTQASHAHAMTETAAGHATLATGVFPSRHGIVSNAWRQRTGFTWFETYAVADSLAPIVAFEDQPTLEGRSPKNMLREGIADWVLAQDPEARTVSISKKDRAAITMAGQTRSNVWWLFDRLGLFVTSRHYASTYPDWMRRFNRDVMPRFTADTEWRSLVPSGAHSLAADDRFRYEGNGEHTTFPHRARDEVPSGDAQATNIWAFDQPRADDAVLELAKRAIDELDLGQRGPTDFLAVSFSALDRVGHAYGPLSQEAFSTMLNLDLVLGNLLTYLDEVVGEGRWVAGLAGDHGAVDIPERARQMGNEEAERIDQDDLFDDIGDVVRDAASSGGRPEAVAELIAELLEEREIAAAAYTHHELTLGGEPADSFAVLFRNSHYPGRSWGILSRAGVEVRFGEGDLVSPYRTGTNHGSPYWYDRHVEMMLLGPGVPPGSSDIPAYTVDFAPTLAALARVGFPDDLDGRRLF